MISSVLFWNEKKVFLKNRRTRKTRKGGKWLLTLAKLRQGYQQHWSVTSLTKLLKSIRKYFGIECILSLDTLTPSGISYSVLDKKRIYFYLRREAQVAIEEEGEYISK